MPYKDKAKYNEYQRNYKKKQAAELKALRQKVSADGKKEVEKQ
jgi:hypothetical protein